MRGTPELLPEVLKGVTEVHTARFLGVGWCTYRPSGEDFGKYEREDVITGLLYTPVQRVALESPLEKLLEPQTKVPWIIHPMADGYFIAYGRDASAWLILVERNYDFLVIRRLQSIANEAEEPVFSKL